MSFYDFKNSQQTCKQCGWTGPGSEAALGDTYAEGAEYHCPKCDNYFGFQAYPTLEEATTDPRAPRSDRLFAEIVIRRTS